MATRAREPGNDGVKDPLSAASTAAAVTLGKVPPHDLDAERAVLGGVMLDNSTLATVEAVLVPADFYHPAHGLIFESVQALSRKGAPVDTITLVNELRARDRLNTIGGVEYVSELTDTIPTTAHIEQHARIVADLAQVRRLIGAAHEIVARGFGELGSPEGFLDTAAARVFEVAQKRSKSTVVSLESAVLEAFDRVTAGFERGSRIMGLESGFHALDNLTAGLHPGQLIIIAARPAMGKTSFVLNIADHAAVSSKRPVLFFSLEMPRIELANRMMCARAGVDQSRLRSGMLTEEDMRALTEAASSLFKLPVWIDDSGDLTLVELRAKARRLKTERDLGMIVIDYLQLMRASREGMESREREISEISRGLKALAKELELPILALSQLNRSPETRPGKDRRPQLSDLRESGAIEQDADVVAFIYRDEVYNRETTDRGIAEIIVAKQRNGPTDTVRLRFIRELTKFDNLAEDGSSYGDAMVRGDVEETYGGP